MPPSTHLRVYFLPLVRGEKMGTQKVLLTFKVVISV